MTGKRAILNLHAEGDLCEVFCCRDKESKYNGKQVIDCCPMAELFSFETIEGFHFFTGCIGKVMEDGTEY